MELVSKQANATSPANRSALPSAWIDKLFARFHAMYGKHWLDLWDGAAMADVKTVWAEDLAGCNGEQIRRAIDHCRGNLKFPPTCPEFVAICRQFRERPENMAFLPAPRGEINDEVQTKIAEALQPAKHDCRAWARKILERSAHGVIYPHIAIENAKEALAAPAY